MLKNGSRIREPIRPSLKLSSAERLPNLAASRAIEPAKLPLLVRGDLDWIVMKSIDKDRNRRYETATGLADELNRYMAGQAVWRILRKQVISSESGFIVIVTQHR